SFNDGKYLSWDITGDVKIRLTYVAGSNANMQAFFFDAAEPTNVQLKSPRKNSEGKFEAEIVGPVGQQFAIQSSPDFVNWTSVSTNTLTNTTHKFVEPNNTPSGERHFYRAVPLP